MKPEPKPKPFPKKGDRFVYDERVFELVGDVSATDESAKKNRNGFFYVSLVLREVTAAVVTEAEPAKAGIVTPQPVVSDPDCIDCGTPYCTCTVTPDSADRDCDCTKKSCCKDISPACECEDGDPNCCHTDLWIRRHNTVTPEPESEPEQPADPFNPSTWKRERPYKETTLLEFVRKNPSAKISIERDLVTGNWNGLGNIRATKPRTVVWDVVAKFPDKPGQRSVTFPLLRNAKRFLAEVQAMKPTVTQTPVTVMEPDTTVTPAAGLVHIRKRCGGARDSWTAMCNYRALDGSEYPSHGVLRATDDRHDKPNCPACFAKREANKVRKTHAIDVEGTKTQWSDCFNKGRTYCGQQPEGRLIAAKGEEPTCKACQRYTRPTLAESGYTQNPNNPFEWLPPASGTTPTVTPEETTNETKS